MINIEKLRKDAEERKRFKKKCFKKLLDMCLTKIEIVAITDANNTWFEIPSFIFGYPSYKVNEAADYIIKKLVKNGFKVNFLNPNLLFINWLV